ncbi:DUF1223 domain-containing protein [Sphingomonas sp. PAMC 26621]|uniref:DUF1223 domain-containing protein n=1 Tax=Sphingomonas sp. PAMC 26621 TaxID=1112213 RepID=UPI0002895EFA|nr:DUF1223 domain-containing protein [Sphingomonas sp. PAMC 26621]
MMRTPYVIFALLAVTAGSVAAVESSRGATQPAALRHGGPVLVELYQSQGCSSCPPADTNVNALADRPDVVALSFGVTYWDTLGWRDTFAKPEFTERQWDFARFNHRGNVATPQVWINGNRTIVGNNRSELEASIRTASAEGPALAIRGGTVAIAAGRSPARGADVWVATFDPRTVQVAIRAGENGGRTIPHRNIVRQLTMVGHWTGPSAKYALPHAAPGLATAVFLQAGRGGPVIAAVKAS